MRKYSKSDQDPHQTDRDREAMAEFAKTTSQHFAVGTFVIRNHERAEVIGRPGNGFMLVQYADGTTEILRPYALQWEN